MTDLNYEGVSLEIVKEQSNLVKGVISLKEFEYIAKDYLGGKVAR